MTIAQGEQAGWDKENLPERKGAWRKNEEGRAGFWIKEGFFKEWPHPHPGCPSSVAIACQSASCLRASNCCVSTAGNTGLGFLSSQTVSSPRGGPVSPALSLSQRTRGRGCAAKVGCPRTGWAGQTGAWRSATPASSRGRGGGRQELMWHLECPSDLAFRGACAPSLFTVNKYFIRTGTGISEGPEALLEWTDGGPFSP